MIADTGCYYGFAQVGQGEIFHAHLDSFYEIEDCSTYTGYKEYDTPNTAHSYVVDHSIGVGSVALYVDGVLAKSLPVDWIGNSAQYYGETHAKDDQQYGARTVPGVFSNLTDCYYNSGYLCYNPLVPLSDPPIVYNNNETYWFENNTSAVVNIGDLACTS